MPESFQYSIAPDQRTSGVLLPQDQYEAVQQYDSAIGPMPLPAQAEESTPWYIWAGLAVGLYYFKDDLFGKSRSRRRRR